MGCRGLIVFIFAFPLFAAGCNNSDRDHLARAAGKARDKMKGLTGETGQSLTTGWQSMALDARVSARIHWDKTLSALSRIESRHGEANRHREGKDKVDDRDP